MRVSAALLAAYVQCTCAMVFSDFNPLGPKLKSQTPPKYALTAPTTSTQGYAVREKMLSISGEDFYVEREGGGRAFDIVGSNKVPFGVGGFVLDKMELKAAASSAAVLAPGGRDGHGLDIYPGRLHREDRKRYRADAV